MIYVDRSFDISTTTCYVTASVRLKMESFDIFIVTCH